MADAADFRRIALSFDGTREHPHFDWRAFKARVSASVMSSCQGGESPTDVKS